MSDLSRCLPPFIWTEILRKLPAKILARCRCVCKSWDSLIVSPAFLVAYLKYYTQNESNTLLLYNHVSEPPLKEDRAARMNKLKKRQKRCKCRKEDDHCKEHSASSSTTLNNSFQQTQGHKDKQNDEKPCKSTVRVSDLTCYSMDFIGLPLAPEHDGDFSLQKVLEQTEGVKIGIIDSFDRSEASSHNFNCFRRTPIVRPVHHSGCKVQTRLSPHGYHCAAVLCGDHQEADFFGLCNGTIRGVVPNAQLYIYPVGCKDCGVSPELLAMAIDLAIKDGVKVISMSQGARAIDFESFEEDWSFEEDVIAQKTLEAFKNDIMVCVPAGNDGPGAESLLYGMPWSPNTGACTSGKTLVTDVTIGTKKKVHPSKRQHTELDENHGEIRILDTIEGISMNIQETSFLQLRISNNLPRDKESVLCVSPSGDHVTLKAATKEQRLSLCLLNIFKRPRVSLSRENSEKLRNWQSNFGELYVRISKSRYGEDPRGVYVPAFSGRGPSRKFPEIIMPDFVGPACNILASYPNDVPYKSIMKRKGDSWEEEDLLCSQRIVTGTSVSNPHVAGLFLVLLCNRPQWSLSMAKSAAITSARSFMGTSIPGDPFVYGAGTIDLKAALNPGLVYDESHANYEKYAKGRLDVSQLNLPSFAASFTQSHQMCRRTFPRTLTNISGECCTYKAKIEPYGDTSRLPAQINVDPETLSFGPGESKGFDLEVGLLSRPSGQMCAHLVWKEESSGHTVVSPIHLYLKSAYDRRLWYHEMTTAEKKGREKELKRQELKEQATPSVDAREKGKMAATEVKKITGEKRPRFDCKTKELPSW